LHDPQLRKAYCGPHMNGNFAVFVLLIIGSWHSSSIDPNQDGHQKTPVRRHSRHGREQVAGTPRFLDGKRIAPLFKTQTGFVLFARILAWRRGLRHVTSLIA
jgi:hypothetical protein